MRDAIGILLFFGLVGLLQARLIDRMFKSVEVEPGTLPTAERKIPAHAPTKRRMLGLRRLPGLVLRLRPDR